MAPLRSLRPLTVGMVFEIGIRVIRRHLGVLLLVAFVFQIPAALLTTAAGMALADTMMDLVPGLGTAARVEIAPLTQDDAWRLASSIGLAFVATSLAGVLGSIGALAFTAVVAADHDGRRIGATDACLVALRRAIVALGVIVLTTLAVVALGLAALGVGWAALATMPPEGVSRGGPGVFAALVAFVALAFALVYLSVRWGVALPVAALEARGSLATLSRSWRLTSGNAWRTLGVLVGSGLASAVLGAVVSQLLSIVLVDLPAQSLDLGSIPQLVVGVVASVVVAPLAPVIVAVLYHDLRARHDAPAAAPGTTLHPG